MLWTHTSSVITRASIASASLSLVASASLLALSYVEHIYTYKPSSILNLFLLFSAIFDATKTRTLWLQGYNRPNAIISLVSTGIKIILLALEVVEKRALLRSSFCALPPEATSGIFSQWLFWWQLPLFRAGYSKQLEVDDLFRLDKNLDSQYLQGLLQRGWDRGS